MERALSGAAGVTRARVNYAIGRAEVVVDSARVDVALLQAAVKRAGYGIAEIDDEPGRAESSETDELRSWLRRVVFARPLAAGVLVLSLSAMSEPWARWLMLAPR